MAITRSQQAKQMLQDGGMLVKPGFGGTRQGYRSERAQEAQGRTGTGSSNTGNTGGDREGRRAGQYSSPEGKAVADRNTDRGGFSLSNLTPISVRLAKNLFDKLGRRKFNPFGPTTFGGLSTQSAPYGNRPGDLRGRDIVDFSDDGRGDDGMPLYAQLGYPSQESYMAAMRLTRPTAAQPQQGIGALDLNRIAYRFMADGGFLEDTDEARQAYGLGSIVRKITRPIKKVVKKATRTVKKVAKSPTGRLLLSVAAPYALGPAMANAGFLTGLSAAQKAAVISGATTGITQLASGEDLDFKDIALSAALSGGISKFTTPTGGVDRQAFNAARTSAGRAPGIDRQAFSAARLSGPKTLDPSSIAGQARVAGDQILASTVTPEKTSLFSSLGKSLKNIGDSKVLQFAKDNPFLTIAGASGLAGLMAKQEEQEEPGELDRGPGIDIAAIRRRPFDTLAPRFGGSQFDFYAAEGGQAKKEPVAKKVMPLLDMGGMEKDYRAEGGFVPIGRMEKADDVPARLSKNEFVFTADAVRNAGDGDVDKGAEVMYNMMKNLEAGGDVSEESQGLQGARRMFQTSQRLEEVL